MATIDKPTEDFPDGRPLTRNEEELNLPLDPRQYDIARCGICGARSCGCSAQYQRDQREFFR